MKIGVFLVNGDDDDALVWARAMVQSAKFQMPRVEIVQFTDMTSDKIAGVDRVMRKPSEPMARLRMRHQAAVSGDWLFVDTDVIFQAPVTKVFKCYPDFHVALTTREWSHLKVASGFSERMPFNTGVVFSRCPSFWAEAYTRLRQLSPELQQWMGDQEVICEMAQDDASRYRCDYLKGYLYNYPPALPVKADPIENACIVHYKGPRRKSMLLERIQRESRRCA